MMTNGSDGNANGTIARGRWALLGAFVLTMVFGANVASGKINNAAFMGDVAEAIVLFAASIFFVIGVICMEDAANQALENDNGRNDNGQSEGTSRA